MYFRALFLSSLVGLQGILAQQAVCGSCANYGTDSIGRAQCPGSSYWSRFIYPSGSCKSHHELLGGYGCCCNCNIAPAVDKSKLPCTLVFNQVGCYDGKGNVITKGVDYGRCFSNQEQNLGNLADCQGRAKTAVDANNRKYHGYDNPFRVFAVNYVNPEVGYVSIVGVSAYYLAREGHTTITKCIGGWKDIHYERTCTGGWKTTTTVERKICLKNSNAYQSRCLMVENNACEGAYNSTVEFDAF